MLRVVYDLRVDHGELVIYLRQLSILPSQIIHSLQLLLRSNCQRIRKVQNFRRLFRCVAEVVPIQRQLILHQHSVKRSGDHCRVLTGRFVQHKRHRSPFSTVCYGRSRLGQPHQATASANAICCRSHKTVLHMQQSALRGGCPQALYSGIQRGVGQNITCVSIVFGIVFIEQLAEVMLLPRLSFHTADDCIADHAIHAALVIAHAIYCIVVDIVASAVQRQRHIVAKGHRQSIAVAHVDINSILHRIHDSVACVRTQHAAHGLLHLALVVSALSHSVVLPILGSQRRTLEALIRDGLFYLC